VKVTDAGWAQLWVHGVHIDSSYGEEGKGRLTAKAEKINKVSNKLQGEHEREVGLLRIVYEHARSVLRFNGVDNARVIAALRHMDISIEQVKLLDGGTMDDPPDAPVQAVAPSPTAHLSSYEDTASTGNDSEPCATCGQIDQGQTGEYACPKCDLPTVWDRQV
jgi:hypothetical protein